MTDGDYPKGEVMPVKEGGGCVVIIHKKGAPPEMLYGFVNEADAWPWLQRQGYTGASC